MGLYPGGGGPRRTSENWAQPCSTRRQSSGPWGSHPQEEEEGASPEKRRTERLFEAARSKDRREPFPWPCQSAASAAELGPQAATWAWGTEALLPRLLAVWPSPGEWLGRGRAWPMTHLGPGPPWRALGYTAGSTWVYFGAHCEGPARRFFGAGKVLGAWDRVWTGPRSEALRWARLGLSCTVCLEKNISTAWLHATGDIRPHL